MARLCGYAYGHQMSNGNGQANGHRDGTLNVGSSFVAHAMHHKHQDEGDESFNE